MTATIMAASLTAAQAKALGPWSAGWPDSVEIRLGPAPLEAQPSAYVQAAWKGRPYGTTPSARVSAATADGTLLLRLEWASESPRFAITDNNVFADACGALFPTNGKSADLETMGTPDAPVITWYWRAGTELPFVGDAGGLGTVSRRKTHALTASAEWSSGHWAVVFRHPLGQHGFEASGGGSIPAAFAVWRGSADERSGLAAYSAGWLELTIPGGRGAAR